MALHLIGLSLHEENRALDNNELSSQFLTKAKEMDWIPKDQGNEEKTHCLLSIVLSLILHLFVRDALSYQALSPTNQNDQ